MSAGIETFYVEGIGTRGRPIEPRYHRTQRMELVKFLGPGILLSIVFDNTIYKAYAIGGGLFGGVAQETYHIIKKNIRRKNGAH